MSDFLLVPLLPEIFLAIVAMGLLIVGVNQGNQSTPVIASASCGALALAVLLLLRFETSEPQVTMNGFFVLDSFSAYVKILLLIGVLVSIALSVHYMRQENTMRFEYPVLILLSTIGMMVMVSAINMLSLYLGLELQSLALYVLAAFNRHSLRAAEAGAKYFILGALSSGMLLFGISQIYGFTGSLDFSQIAQAVGAGGMNPGIIIGMVFLLSGLAFKVSAVPFHMWTPDVYQGAMTSVTAFFAIVPKLAAMALLARLLYVAFEPAQDQWQQILYALSLGSMIVGAFAGLVQQNIKRLLAYSSIGNMGYALMGIVAGTPDGLGATLVYMLIYMVMTAGVFTVILNMRRGDIAVEGIDSLAGLSKTAPSMAYALAILMFSMAGIPPLAGFFGKLFVFEAAIDQELYALAIIGVLSSVVSSYYYLRIIKVMFFDEPTDALDEDIPFERQAILMLSIIFVLGFIFMPDPIVSGAQNAIVSLF